MKILRQKSTTQESHSHSYGQMSYTFEGVLYLEANNKVFIVPPNMAIYIPAKAVHKNKTHKDVIITTLCFPKTKALFSEIRLITLTQLIKEIINKLCLMKHEELGQPQGKHLLVTLMDEILVSKSVHSTELIITDHPAITKIYEIFRQSKDIYPSSEQSAKLIHVSPRTLLRIFKNETGMSFVLWKQRFLFIKAIELLQKYQNTSLVAYHLGYKSDSAFISMFKKMSGGQTPSDFFIASTVSI